MNIDVIHIVKLNETNRDDYLLFPTKIVAAPISLSEQAMKYKVIVRPKEVWGHLDQ